MHDGPLQLFLPPVCEWFRRTFGTPTPVQEQGWPAIAKGQNTLLFAPTGSGKTLAAFLACLDGLWRQDPIGHGVQVLYISPLKALNNDIHRNLQIPLQGVAAVAEEMGRALPIIEIAVRTGDTPAPERQRLIRHPPHVLITTPESLHLLLTSKARESLRSVTHCIVDEIHALCPNKRGVFLALLLERLQAITARPFARIGLSATQRPLEEVARYLGGLAYDAGGQWRERPVTIVDAGLRKQLDLKVISPTEQFGALPEKSIWPSICHCLANEIRRHRSTIIFANNRRSVERLTAQLNDYLADDGRADTPNDDTVQVRAHHGSVALEVRRATEHALKEGRLRAVVATASLELGIDMGAVDLVCQVESPGNVARGLQRVGRAGHIVGQSSKGRMIPKTLPDLLNQAVLAHEMAAGRVEALRVPTNCLDVLAQQVIAMAAMDVWSVADLYQLVRQAHPYRDLTPAAFDAVLEMVSGRYRFDPPSSSPLPSGGEGPEVRGRVRGLSPPQQLSALQPRISWDRVHQRLHALPGSQRLAVVHGGTIPDTGQYAVYTTRGLRIGEVDEEFVYERRVGESFLLGTNAWRIDRIETDRVLVHPAEGMPAMVPFWRGEQTGRSFDLGLAQGKFLRELTDRIDQSDCLDWLRSSFFLDAAAARNVRTFVLRQLQRTRFVPDDRTLWVEASRDPLGDWQVILLTPFGRNVNFGLRLAIENRLAQRLGYRPHCLHHDDGVLVRLTESDEPVLDLFDGIKADNVRNFILDELADSALFALRFRQNAARALMMPRGAAGKRAPLWLQRLRGRDLLQVARQYPDFPIIAETFRECLHDHLDLPRLQQLLAEVATGGVRVETARLDMPSPFAANLLFAFTAKFMYEYDGVESGRDRAAAPLDEALLNQLIGHEGKPLQLDPRAVQQVDRRLRGVGLPPRTKAEAAEWLRVLGDVGPKDVDASVREFLRELELDGVVTFITLPIAHNAMRWVLTEEAEPYRRAFSADAADAAASRAAASRILQRFLETHAMVGLEDVLQVYPFDRGWTKSQLEEWTCQGRIVPVPRPSTEPVVWSVPENLEQMQRSTLSALRREVMTCPAEQFADFVLRWQCAHPSTQSQSADGLDEVLQKLECFAASLELWDQAVLPARTRSYTPRQLDERMANGDWLWHLRRAGDEKTEQIAFVRRAALTSYPAPADMGLELDVVASKVVDALRSRGAMFTVELSDVTRTPETAIRPALWSLLRAGLISNDLFDLVRHGPPPALDNLDPPVVRSRTQLRAFLRGSGRRHAMRGAARSQSRSEGRWSLIAWGQPDPETAAVFQARLLLERFGVVSRELAIQSGTPTPWRILYEIFSHMELAGDVRRGYFVEGLSGAQFALPEAVKLLADIAMPSQAEAPVVLLHSLDPANLYGAGAPFELVVGSEELRTFQRRAGSWLFVKAGRPLLLVEQHGKRLTSMPHAMREELAQAASQLPELLKRVSNRDMRHKLTVETWNDEAVTGTIGRELLEPAGFVRDYQAMTLYAVWNT